MKAKVFWITLIAVLLSFAGGFLFANALNRGELNALKAESERLKNIQPKNEKSDSVLETEEIL